MDISFFCTRKRKEFGKTCAFVDIGPNLIAEIDQNPSQQEDFYMIPTADRKIDNCSKMCAHEVNTMSYPIESRGINHMEGGWPASVDNTDEDSMARFRKKVEKDKSYVNSVKSLAEFLENFIMENNSINIYEEYFEGEQINRGTDFSVRNICEFHCLNGGGRTVSDLSWTRDSSKFAVAYKLEQRDKYPSFICLDSYVWDVENSISPVYVFKPEVLMSCVECSQTDINLVLSGYICGQVALWDIRVHNHAQMLSDALKGHSKQVTGLKWLVGKHDMAFVSTSTDGKMIAWDARNMSSPTEVTHVEDIIIADNSEITPNYAISCLEYDVTLPNKFMVGTEQGVVLSFNRKYKEIKDILSSLYDCSNGPLLAVERNAFFPQLFATCNAWSVQMWSDALSDFPVLNMVSRDGYFTDLAWSPSRVSSVFVSKSTGILEVWDIPGKNKDALMKLKLADEPVVSVAADYAGDKIVCGLLSGSVQLLKIPEYLKSCSDIEIDIVKNCIRECDKVIGGTPRSERFLQEDAEHSMIRVYDDMWDPPEKAEDLYQEFNLASAEFSNKYENKKIEDKPYAIHGYKDDNNKNEDEAQENKVDKYDSNKTGEDLLQTGKDKYDQRVNRIEKVESGTEKEKSYRIEKETSKKRDNDKVNAYKEDDIVGTPNKDDDKNYTSENEDNDEEKDFETYESLDEMEDDEGVSDS